MSILHLDDKDFESTVTTSKERVLVDFSATWCGPCKVLEPILTKMASSSDGKFRVAKVDIDDSPETAKKYGVRGVPTLVVLEGGKEVARHVGVTNEARLRELVTA